MVAVSSPTTPLAAAAAALRAAANALDGLAAEPVAPTSAVVRPDGDGEPALPWSALLWVVPPETRLNTRQVAEALDRPRSFVYRCTSRRGNGLPRLPHRELGGELVFIASEVREWIAACEVVHVPGRTAPLVVARRKDTV